MGQRQIIYGQDPKGWKWRALEGQGWPSERLEGLNRDELTNLQANAEWLGKPALAALCTQHLTQRARRGAGR